MKELTLDDYTLMGRHVLTWDQLTALYEEYSTEGGELGELIVAIQVGDYQRARSACACLLAGDKP